MQQYIKSNVWLQRVISIVWLQEEVYNGCQSSCEQGLLAMCLRYYVFLVFHTV